MVFVNGHPGRPPVAPFGLQAYHSANAFAAIGTLCALFARRRTGVGQQIDVSIAAGATGALEHVTASYRQHGQIECRRGSLHWTRCFRVGRCLDGYILHCTLGDWTSLVEWVASDGMARDLLQPEWQDNLYRRENCDHLFDVLDGWAARHRVADLMQGAQLRRLPYAIVRPPHQLAHDDQLAARGFFVRPGDGQAMREAPAPRDDVAEPVCPGAPVLFSRTPWASRRRPPRLGEHKVEVLSDPGWSGAEMAQTEPLPTAERKAEGAPPPPPLTGIRVLDFTWVVAGPVATRILADQGATVIKVERRDALDFGSRRGGLSGNLNRGKLSIVLDMNQPRGLDLARRLVARCDLVIDNFSARVMHNWGLDYAGLRAIRDDIVALSMSGFGHTGPQRDFVSYGPTLQALAGFPLQMRLPGEEPAGWGYSYADMAGGYMAALAAVAALWHRQRTGEGQFVDFSQFANLVSLIGPSLFDALRGVPIDPTGNASQEAAAAPHGVYRCAPVARAGGRRDDDRWVAIAVFGDADWRRLVRVLTEDGEEWVGREDLARHEGRTGASVEVDRRLGDWTRRRSAEEVQERLQAAGIAAGVVADAEDLACDPQLAARGYFQTVVTPEGGCEIFDGVPFVASHTPGRITAPGPLLGEHTDEVLRDLLSLDDATLSELRADLVIA
jgi:crotonobetainyl-CoA:carnitine CoA-transferase CaiB-like acyl-CoA transferase